MLLTFRRDRTKEINADIIINYSITFRSSCSEYVFLSDKVATVSISLTKLEIRSAIGVRLRF